MRKFLWFAAIFVTVLTVALSFLLPQWLLNRQQRNADNLVFRTENAASTLKKNNDFISKLTLLKDSRTINLNGVLLEGNDRSRVLASARNELGQLHRSGAISDMVYQHCREAEIENAISQLMVGYDLTVTEVYLIYGPSYHLCMDKETGKLLYLEVRGAYDCMFEWLDCLHADSRWLETVGRAWAEYYELELLTLDTAPDEVASICYGTSVGDPILISCTVTDGTDRSAVFEVTFALYLNQLIFFPGSESASESTP